MLRKTSWFIFFVLLSAACLDEPDCYSLNNNIIGVTFKVIGTGKADTTNILGIGLEGALQGADVDVRQTGNRINFPISYQTDKMVIDFQRPHKPSSISIEYVVKSQFVTKECGPRFVLSDLKIAEGGNGFSGFDSVRVVNATPGRNYNGTNIEVYRCPITNYIGVTFRRLTVNGTGAVSSDVLPIEIGPGGIKPNYSGAIFYPNSQLSTVNLPVDLAKPTSTFTFNDTENQDHEFVLAYTLTDTLRYRKCPQQTTFVSDLRITSSSFDSASIARDNTTGVLFDEPQDPVITNVQLFTCPPTNEIILSFVTATTGNNTRRDTVEVEEIRADHLPNNPWLFEEGVSEVTLTLDENKDHTIFRINYKDLPDRELRINHKNTIKKLTSSCNRVLFSELKEHQEDTKVNIPNAAAQYPPVNNIEIIN